jgi:hypothetical protein
MIKLSTSFLIGKIGMALFYGKLLWISADDSNYNIEEMDFPIFIL